MFNGTTQLEGLDPWARRLVIDRQNLLGRQTAQNKFDAFNRTTHSVQDYAFQGWGSFDVSYAPGGGTGQVKVGVRVGFSFLNGDVVPGESSDAMTWADEAKQEWKEEFMSSIEAVWSGQHRFKCLHQDANHQQSPTWSDLRPGVSIDIIEDASNPHFNVEVTKIPEGAFERSSVRRPSRDTNGQVTTPGVANLDSEDDSPRTKTSSPDGVTQRGSVHEFAHMIGLQDEYATAETDGDMTRQGVPKRVGDNASIMSGGEVVEQAHYSSILEALNAAVANFRVRFGFE